MLCNNNNIKKGYVVLLYKKTGGFKSTCFSLLNIYQLFTHYLPYPCFNVLHMAYPFQLIFIFQLFGHTLNFFHLLNKGIKHISCLMFHLSTVLIKFALYKQCVKKHLLMFFKIGLCIISHFSRVTHASYGNNTRLGVFKSAT